MKSKAATAPDYARHTINVPLGLDKRVARCMTLESMRVFTEFANSALVRKCREIERDHGIDADGRPVK